MKAYEKKVKNELISFSGKNSVFEYLQTIEGREFYSIFAPEIEESKTLILTTAQGRFDRFDIMVIATLNGKIELIRILRYRSEFGSEISNKRWLSQFYSEPDSLFRLRKDIDAISGATFSAQGLIEEINWIRVSIQTRSYLN